MKQILFIALIAVLFTPVGMIAQEAYMESGKIILDMTVAADMPADAVTGTPKYDATYMLSNTPVNSDETMADNLYNGLINARVYEKLEVAPQDLGTSGLNAGTMNMQWAAAFTACKGLDHNGYGWRLPTQRELMMIWIFKDAINALNSSGTSFDTSIYWSSTEDVADPSKGGWGVDFYRGGYTNTYAKNGSVRVRCVREVTP